MKPVYLKAPVRAIIYNEDKLIWGKLFQFHQNILISCLGEGDLLHVRDEVIRIPGSERIIGLDSGSNGSIFIRTEFNLYKYWSKILIKVPFITRDRIIALFDEQDKLWVVQARGTVQLFTFSLDSCAFMHSKSFSLSKSSAVFYSASIIRRFDKIEIAYGTIFSGILLAQIDELLSNIIFSIGTLNGHNGTIFDIKYHPKDQNILISCSDDRSIRLWKRNAENGIFETSVICNGHEARVWSIDVQDDIIASVSEDNNCRIWNLNGNCIKIIEGESYSKSIWSVALNDKAEKVSFGSNDGSVITHNLFMDNKSSDSDLFDYALPKALGSIKNIIISNEGICYAATDQNKLVKITNYYSIDIKGISAMAINSKTLFIGDDEGNIFFHKSNSDNLTIEKLLTIETNRKITKIHAQEDVLFIETENYEFYLFYLLEMEIKRIEIDKKYKITSFCFDLIKEQILIGTRQGVLLVFNQNSLLKTIKLTHQETLKSIKILSNDQISVLDRSGSEIILNNFIVLSRKKIGKGILESHLNSNFVSSFYQQCFLVSSPFFGLVDKIFCGGCHRLYSASSNSKAFYFAFISNGKLKIRQGSLENIEMVSSKSHGKEIRCAHNLSMDFIISGSEDGLLILYKGLKFINELRLTNTSIKCITSIDDFVFVGGSNETIEAFELNKTFFNHLSSCPKQIKSLETRVFCLDAKKFNDKILILAGYSDASIRLFEYQNDSFHLKGTAEKVHQNRCVQQIRFLPSLDSCKFISAGADGFIQAWILKEGELERGWECCVHQSGINAIDLKVLGNDKVYVLTGGEDGSISFLNISDDEIEKLDTKKAHNSTVTGVKFIKDDSFISASIDRYVYIHDNSGNPKRFRTVISDISAISMTPNNLFVYGAGIEAFDLNCASEI